MSIDVSIIITVYNYQCDKKIEAVFQSWKKQTANIELILCEQGLSINKEFFNICTKYSVKYIHCYPDIIEGKIAYNIGRVRNIAALFSKGIYLYFSDADVLVTNPNYLRNLLSFSYAHNDVPMIRPFARRLVIKDCESFCESYCKNININMNNNDYFCYAEFDEQTVIIKRIKCDERYRLVHNILHVCSLDQYKNIQQESKFSTDNIEQFFGDWKTAMHYGGLFCSFNNFIKAVGYSEYYYNWGYEDTDIQWKLDEFTGIQLVDSAVKECSLIHFEHPIRCENSQYETNTKTFEQRKDLGQHKAIENDKNNKNSFMAAWLKNDLVKIRQYINEEYDINDLRRPADEEECFDNRYNSRNR